MTAVCLSPNGSTVYRLDAPPTRIVVATIEGVAILERAAAGAPWSLVHRAIEDRHVGSLVLEPESGALFAGAHNGGLFRSRDGGTSWDRCAGGAGFDHVFSLACAAETDGAAVYAGTQPVSLYRSRDLGESWQELPAIARVPGHEKWWTAPPPHHARTKSLTIDPRDPRIIYAAIEQGALLKSTDGGESWRELDSYYRENDPWYRDIHRVVQLPSDPDILLMTSGTGLYRSEDAGENWVHLTDVHFRIAYPDQLAVSPSDNDVLLMAGGATDPSQWRATGAAAGAVLRSEDGGRTWVQADDGLARERPNVEAMCLASYPGGYCVFAGNTDGEVGLTENDGRSWTRIADGLPPISKTIHYRNIQAAE